MAAPKNRAQPWTPTEVELVRVLYSERGATAAECAAAVGRDYPSIKNLIQRRQFKAGKRPSAMANVTLPPIEFIVPPPPPPEPARDPIEIERERQEASRRLREEREALRDIAGERSLRRTLEQMFSAIVPQLEAVLPPAPVKPNKRDQPSTESLLLHLSDWHYGERVDSESTRGFNAYNVAVAERRVHSIVDNAIAIAKKMEAGGGWRFPRLVVALNGDLVTGTIHELERHSDPANIIWAVYECAMLLASALQKLAGAFPQVDVYCTSGNHGRLPDARRMQSKDPTRNWDTLVALIAKTALREQKNVTITIPNSYAVSYEVEGTTVLQSHGHDIKSWSGIPWYGISRFLGNYNGMEAARGGRIGAYLFGHFHSQTNITYPGGEAFVNGSLIGGTEWTVGTLGRADRPCQVMLAFHPEHGVTHRWPIYAEG
jgi:hypothetical protein